MCVWTSSVLLLTLIVIVIDYSASPSSSPSSFIKMPSLQPTLQGVNEVNSTMTWVHWSGDDEQLPVITLFNIAGIQIARLPLALVKDPEASEPWPWSEVLFLLGHLFPDHPDTPLLVSRRPRAVAAPNWIPINQEDRAEAGEFTVWASSASTPQVDLYPSGGVVPASRKPSSQRSGDTTPSKASSASESPQSVSKYSGSKWLTAGCVPGVHEEA